METTIPGTPEHKREVCMTLIRTYHENIVKDELYLVTLEEAKAAKQTEIKAIESKLERKEYKTKNEGEKVKFVAERELAAIAQEIAVVTDKVKALWPARIRQVEQYMAQMSASN